MSLSSPGGFESPDWQAEVHYDGPAIDTFQPGSIAGPVTRGPFGVANWATTAGQMVALGGACFVQMAWYADAAATQLVGSKSFLLHNLNGSVSSWSIRNRGRYLKYTLTGIGGNFSPAILLYGSNRPQSSECPAVNDFLIDQQNVTVANGATSQFYPASYYAGPVSAWFLYTASTFFWEIQAFTIGNTWDIVNDTAPVVSTNQTLALAVPMGAWRVAVSNNGGVGGNFFLALIACPTGVI